MSSLGDVAGGPQSPVAAKTLKINFNSFCEYGMNVGGETLQNRVVQMAAALSRGSPSDLQMRCLGTT